MGRITPEERDRRLEQVYIPPAIKTAGRYLGRAERTLGLLGGTVVGGALNVMLDPSDKTPVGQWLPDWGNIPEAFGAFEEQQSQGDWDAAITAAQEELDAGKYFWGTAEALTSAFVPTGGPALAGLKLMRTAKPIAGAFARMAPVSPRTAVQIRSGLRPVISGTGKALRLPWEAEEWVGRQAIRPFAAGWRALRGTPSPTSPTQLADTVEDVPSIVDESGKRAAADRDVLDAASIARGRSAKLAILQERHKRAEDEIRSLEDRLAQARERLEMPAVVEEAPVVTPVEIPLTREAREAALTRRLQDQAERNEAGWFIESFNDQLDAAKAAERSARREFLAQENITRGRVAATAMAQYRADVGLAKARITPTERVAGEAAEAAEEVGGPLSKITEDVIDEVGDAGPRKGNLLQGKTAEALGSNYKVKGVLRVAQDLEDQIASIRNRMVSRANIALRSTGRIGRVALLGESPDRMLDVLGTPSIYDVAENTKFYRDSGVLTPEQIDGVQQLTRIVEDIKKEREIFGIGPNEIMMGEEGNFLPRLAVKKTPVGWSERLKGLVRPMEREELAERGFGGGFGRRGAGPSAERGRVVGVGEVAEAEARGTVYAGPVEAINAYANRWLTASADEHVKSLLVPFGDSASMRLPPGLQNRIATLRQNVQSLHESGILMLEKEDIALRAFLYSDDPGITHQFREAIENISITKGEFKGQDLEGTRRLLLEMKREIKKLAPEWETAVADATKTPAGRHLVSQDAVPMLKGMDWTKADKNAIQKHYTHWRASAAARNAWVSGVMQTTANVKFLNATFDFSALLRQQASTATVHPQTYLKNVFRGFVDIVDSRAYDELLASPEGQHAASRGIAIFGDAKAAELQATSWLDQVIHMKGWMGKPFLPLRAFNDHFIRFNTRQRIDIFRLEVNRLTKRYGRELTPDEEDAVARAINRATGVSKSRGRGVTRSFLDDSLFAARYTRATIEEIVEAVGNRSIEGEIARRQILLLIAVVSGLSVSVAMMQNRPIEEVTTPWDVRRMDQGELALNPNFLSIRVAGHDIKPLGAYDSLARIAFMATDLLWGGIGDGQFKKMTEFLTYSVGTKGNPLVSFGVDLFRGGFPGKTFTGEDTLHPVSLAKRVAPFGIQSAAESIQRGMPLGQAIGGALLEGLGTKTSPMSFSDFSSEYARKMYGVGYLDLESWQKINVRESIESDIEAGKIARRQPADGYWAELEDIDAAFDGRMKTVLSLIESRSRERGELVSMYFNARDERRQAKDYAAEEYGMEDYELNPRKDPNKLALQAYYDLYEASKVRAGEEGVPIYSSQEYAIRKDGYLRNLAINAPEQLQYVFRNTNTRKIPTGILNILPRGIRRDIKRSEDARRDFESQLAIEKAPELVGTR